VSNFLNKLYKTAAAAPSSPILNDISDSFKSIDKSSQGWSIIPALALFTIGNH
jgi:hypothetical protein